MWDKWFRQWIDAIFWWLPSKESETERRPQRDQAERSQREADQSRTQAEPAQTAAESAPAAAPAQEEKTAAAPAGPKPKAPAGTAPAPAAASDDLTTIKGLGPAMQSKLAGIGITSFKDLAAADAQELTDQLKPTQRTVTKEKVQGWIREARKLQG